MVTIKTNSKKASLGTTSHRSLKLWLVASLVVNVLFILSIICTAVMYKSGRLDYAIVNKGIDVMCSDRFHSTVKRDDSGSPTTAQQAVAVYDFICQSNETAKKMWTEGFNNYLKAIGLPTTNN